MPVHPIMPSAQTEAAAADCMFRFSCTASPRKKLLPFGISHLVNV